MAKTLSFAGVHFTVAFGVGYLLSGSITVGGAIALVEPLCNTIAYFFHEKLWERRRQRQAAGADLPDEHRGSRTVFPV
jgi:uncharacterized membrane protein